MESKKCYRHAACGVVSALIVSFLICMFIFPSVGIDQIESFIARHGSLIAGLIAFSAAVIALYSQKETTRIQVNAQFEINSKNRFNEKKEDLIKSIMNSMELISSLRDEYRLKESYCDYDFATAESLPPDTNKNILKLQRSCINEYHLIDLVLLQYPYLNDKHLIKEHLVFLQIAFGVINYSIFSDRHRDFFGRNKFLMGSAFINKYMEGIAEESSIDMDDCKEAFHQNILMNSVYSEVTRRYKNLLHNIVITEFQNR